MKLQMSIEGTKALLASLEKQDGIALQVAGEAVLDAAEIIRAEVERRAPRRTGALAGEGFTTKAGYKTRFSSNAIVTITDREFEYAFYQEFGVKSNHVEPHPFIRPAFETKKDEAESLVVKRLKEKFD